MVRSKARAGLYVLQQRRARGVLRLHDVVQSCSTDGSESEFGSVAILLLLLLPLFAALMLCSIAASVDIMGAQEAVF